MSRRGHGEGRKAKEFHPTPLPSLRQGEGGGVKEESHKVGTREETRTPPSSRRWAISACSSLASARAAWMSSSRVATRSFRRSWGRTGGGMGRAGKDGAPLQRAWEAREGRRKRAQ